MGPRADWPDLDRKTYNLWAGGQVTLTRKELHAFLLQTGGQILRSGHLCDIKSKHLGAGVYCVTAEPRKYRGRYA